MFYFIMAIVLVSLFLWVHIYSEENPPDNPLYDVMEDEEYLGENISQKDLQL